MDSLFWILLISIAIPLLIWVVGRVRRSPRSSNIYELETKSLQQHQEAIVKPKESTPVIRPDPKNHSSEDLMRAVEEKLKGTHYYGKWSWRAQSYTEWLLTITHPYNWKLVGDLTWYYIPWANMSVGTSPLGASLSWVNTQYFTTVQKI